MGYHIIKTGGYDTRGFGFSVYKSKTEILEFPDLTESSEELDLLLNTIEEEKIEFCHIVDFIEDYLTDFTV